MVRHRFAAFAFLLMTGECRSLLSDKGSRTRRHSSRRSAIAYIDRMTRRKGRMLRSVAVLAQLHAQIVGAQRDVESPGSKSLS